MSKTRKLIFVLLLLVILARPVQVVIQNRNHLFSPGYEKEYPHYKSLYYSSQYIQKKDPIIIPDYSFRAFAGGAFLKGLNPILLVHDHPPLGNYMIAASIYFFDNPRTLIVPIMAFILLGVYLLARLAIGNTFFALIPLAIFANEPLVLDKLVHAPLIEPIQFPFILFAFYCFIKGLRSKKYYVWFISTVLLLGIVISTRFFVTGAIMTFCMGIYLFYKVRLNKKFFFFIASLPLAFIILILSYTKTIMDGSSILHIFGIQKYILLYHKSKFVVPFSFWDLLLFNRLHKWWGDWGISFDPLWSVFWPIATFITAIYGFSSMLKKVKVNETEEFLFLWLMVYTATLSTGYSSTSYFLPILPFFYILSVSFIRKGIILLNRFRISESSFHLLPI